MGYRIEADSISEAWLLATRYILNQNNAECNNLLVEINQPLNTLQNIEESYEQFCSAHNIKHFTIPAQTIFPKKAYLNLNQDRAKLYRKYPRLHKVLKGKWGSYFGQMINWKINGAETPSINQLEQLISMLNNRNRTYSSAYTIQITNPIDHFTYPIGGPCLHYILLQLDRIDNRKIMNLLAVYRNHDFAVKAYGNYVGLGHLLEFICNETDYEVGKLSCVSSHAYVESKHRTPLRRIVGRNQIATA